MPTTGQYTGVNGAMVDLAVDTQNSKKILLIIFDYLLVLLLAIGLGKHAMHTMMSAT